MHNPAGSVQNEVLSALKSAKNRLEYLTQNDWALIIDRSKRCTFKKGETLIQQGKQTRFLYLLVKGRIDIHTAQARIAIIGPGEICGEMAFLENSLASATATAEQDVDTCAVEWSALVELFELFPHLASRFYRSLALSLSRRLRGQVSPTPGQ
jgi:CRP-like cAMP-binding protein